MKCPMAAPKKVPATTTLTKVFRNDPKDAVVLPAEAKLLALIKFDII